MLTTLLAVLENSIVNTIYHLSGPCVSDDKQPHTLLRCLPPGCPRYTQAL